MKSVLISIQPKWCELIASGKKTVEVRKTKPKLETPFKVYIYCTANKQGTKDLLEIHGTDGKIRKANGKVIGEFVCDEIIVAECGNYCNISSKEACLTAWEMLDYADEKTVYGWHISNLVIYDKPRELSKFVAEGECDFKQCKKCRFFYGGNGYYDEPDCLEKQIPKKPKEDGWLYCPVCGRDVCVEKPKYCADCGQALDWGDWE